MIKLCEKTFVFVAVTSLFVVSQVNGQAFEATITGTLSEAELNGVDISNSEFIFTATIFDLTDHSDNVVVGSYVARFANFDFGSNGSFVADEDQLAFILTNDNSGGFFQAGFTSDAKSISDAHGYTAFFDPLIFDPNRLLEIPLFQDFDDKAENGIFSVSNVDGDTLLIDELQQWETATAQVTALTVPEPNAATLLFAAFAFMAAKRNGATRPLVK